MKKIFTYILFAAMSACTLTSCEDDEQMAILLDGMWRGTMYETYYDHYDGYFEGSEYYTMFRFNKRGTYEGYGTERDEDGYGNVVERDFEWKVSWSTIYLYYDDVYYYNGRAFRDNDYRATIYNASLDRYYFSGDMDDNAGNRRHFRMEYYANTWGYARSVTRSAEEPPVATPEMIDALKIKAKPDTK